MITFASVPTLQLPSTFYLYRIQQRTAQLYFVGKVSRAENAEPRELAVEVCGPALRLRGPLS